MHLRKLPKILSSLLEESPHEKIKWKDMQVLKQESHNCDWHNLQWMGIGKEIIVGPHSSVMGPLQISNKYK